MARKLASWVSGFEQFTEKTGSPPLFRRWTAIFTMAAAMERKVWIVTNKGVLYPNLYIVLVGPAGAGKTVALDVGHDMLKQLEEHHIAPTAVTRASMIDKLYEAERKIVRPQDNPPVISFNSVAIMSNELGVLLPTYENEFINVLTDLYDCKRYEERKRTAKLEIDIRNPQFNIIAATTPSYLNNLMPEGAWDQGFISRTLLIYSGRGPSIDLFENVALNGPLQSALVADLKEIGELYGKVRFHEDVVEAFRAWMKAGEVPLPEHPRLQHYSSRRQAHLLKLCIASCISSSNDLIVTLDNYVEAMDWLVEAEAVMPDIFKAMSVGTGGRVMDDTWYYAYTRWMKDKKPIPEALLIEFISQRAPSHEVGRILEVMTRAKLFEATALAGIGTCYTPRAKRSV